MPQGGWLARAHSARRERVLRWSSVAVASTTEWVGRRSSGAPTRQRYQSAQRITGSEVDAMNRSARVPAAQRVGSLQGPGQPASLRHRSARKQESDSAVAGAGRSGRADLERRDSADTKTGPERFLAAAALIRLGWSLRIVAEPMLYRGLDRPSRRRHRKHGRGGSVFPRREVGGPSRPARAGVRRAACATTRALYSSSGGSLPQRPRRLLHQVHLDEPVEVAVEHAVGSPTSSFVRWSLTSWYGCST